jgi:hypothetical protein
MIEDIIPVVGITTKAERRARLPIYRRGLARGFDALAWGDRRLQCGELSTSRLTGQLFSPTPARWALRGIVPASSGPRGCVEAVLRAHGFDAALLAELVNAGLASLLPERVQAGGRPVDVARCKITAAGRSALA